jgi:hypothetical protein
MAYRSSKLSFPISRERRIVCTRDVALSQQLNVMQGSLAESNGYIKITKCAHAVRKPSTMGSGLLGAGPCGNLAGAGFKFAEKVNVILTTK